MRAAATRIEALSRRPALRRAVAAAAAALALAGCAAQTPSASVPPPTEAAPVAAADARRVDLDRPVRVALLAPIGAAESRTQAIATDLEAAARLAAREARAPGVDLRVYDTAGQPAAAASAARRAVAEGAAILLGPLYSATTSAVRPVAEETGAPVLSFSSDSAAGGAPVWVLGDLPENEVDRILAYAASQGIGSVAVVYPQTDYGTLVSRAVRRNAPRHGVAVADSVPYARSFQGVQAAAETGATRILASGATAALLADGGPALRTVASFMAFNDVLQPEVRYLGLGLWATPDTLAEAPLEGGWFAAVDPSADDAFEARFESAAGRRPHPLASLGYDAVRAVEAMIAAARAAGSERPFTAEAITDPNGFAGARGAFRLTPDGANRRALAVLEVGADDFLIRDPAPALPPAGF